MSDSYKYWFEELAKPGCNDRDSDRIDVCGFWRIKGAVTKWDTPWAIWFDAPSDQMVLRIGESKKVHPYDSKVWWNVMLSVWNSAQACTEDDYRGAMETGLWLDGKAAKESTLPKKKPKVKKEPEETPAPVEVDNRPKQEEGPRSVGMGHNKPPEDMGKDYAERLKAEVKLIAELLKKSFDESVAEEIGECKNRVGKIKSEATKEHKDKKAPWLAGGNIVDAAYNPTIKSCVTVNQRASAALTDYLQKQQAIKDEEARQLQIKEQAELDRQAKEKAELEGEKTEEEEKAKPTPPPKKAPLRTERASVGKAAGRSVHLTTITTAEIIDLEMLRFALKDNEEVIALLQRLADNAARSGSPLPGTEIKTTQKTV